VKSGSTINIEASNNNCFTWANLRHSDVRDKRDNFGMIANSLRPLREHRLIRIQYFCVTTKGDRLGTDGHQRPVEDRLLPFSWDIDMRVFTL
jgi:hypothetical protein